LTVVHCRLQVASKTFALVGAAILLLDFASTAVVSSATAARYVINELPFNSPEWACSAIILGVFLVVAMIGIKESAHVALGILTFHVRDTHNALILTTSANEYSDIYCGSAHRRRERALGIHWERTPCSQLAGGRRCILIRHCSTYVRWNLYWDAWSDRI
jgi:hypothetical protein